MGDVFARGTVEKLHSLAKTSKGPSVVAPLISATSLVAGARNHLQANRSLAFRFEVTA